MTLDPTVSQKYTNFINFVDENLNKPMYSTALRAISCEQFLGKLKEQGDKTPKELTEQVANKIGIDLASYSVENVTKFERYLTYFQGVTKIVYTI
jgi:hypothetical protein